MKRCFKCGIEKELSEFYRHPKMGDGHLNKCKECTKKDTKERSILKSDYVKEYDRKRQYEPKRKEYLLDHMHRYRKANPEKYKAHSVVNYALRSGKLVKPKNCEICGVETVLSGHHTDYSKPLEVMWLCPACHAHIHL